jgi:hypothetical protein
MKTKLLILVLLNSAVGYSQSNIVAAGHENFTVGSDLVQMQIPIVKDPVLSVPKYEIPAEPQKPKPAKKKSFIQKLLEFIKKLIN